MYSEQQRFGAFYMYKFKGSPKLFSDRTGLSPTLAKNIISDCQGVSATVARKLITHGCDLNWMYSGRFTDEKFKREFELFWETYKKKLDIDRDLMELRK